MFKSATVNHIFLTSLIFAPQFLGHTSTYQNSPLCYTASVVQNKWFNYKLRTSFVCRSQSCTSTPARHQKTSPSRQSLRRCHSDRGEDNNPQNWYYVTYFLDHPV